MDDQQRLQRLVSLVSERAGHDEPTYARLAAALGARLAPAGGSAKPRLAMFDAKRYDVQAFERRNSGDCVLLPIEAPLSAETAAAAAGCVAACVFVNDRCDAAAIDALADLGVGLVALRCAGFNNIDLGACRERAIDVVHVPAYSPHAVAEHTVALMLMLNRKLHLAYQRNRTGAFTLDGLTGFDVYGKTVGVVGAGRIGRCVVDILLGFGCRVLVYDTHPPEDLAVRAGVRLASLDELLAESDVVTLHVPLFPDTHHLIDGRAIARMKRGAMLLNTSRGGLVDTPALVEGLKSGQIGAAGLDVYEEEAGIFFHDLSGQVMTDDVLARLMTFNNVVVTSHQAFLTTEALDAIADATLASVAEYAAGKRGKELTRRVPTA
ncbi:MAG: 2-hydroxyacid dehydrogenase [Lacipirellulaceae bacterium]